MSENSITMIEKVARALCVANGYDPDKLEPGNCAGDWEGVDGVLPNGDVAHWLWRDWSDRAKAAIEAMREPSDLLGLPEGYRSGSHSATQIWRCMIDSALDGK